MTRLALGIYQSKIKTHKFVWILIAELGCKDSGNDLFYFKFDALISKSLICSFTVRKHSCKRAVLIYRTTEGQTSFLLNSVKLRKSPSASLSAGLQFYGAKQFTQLKVIIKTTWVLWFTWFLSPSIVDHGRNREWMLSHIYMKYQAWRTVLDKTILTSLRMAHLKDVFKGHLTSSLPLS